MKTEDLKRAMDAAEARFDAAVILLRRARADLGRSKSKKRADALVAAEGAYDRALKVFRRAASAHSKSLAADVAAFKMKIAPAAPQMDLFA